MASSPPCWWLREAHVAAVDPRDVARDAQPQAGAAGFAAARTFEPDRRARRPLELVVRDPGTVVADADGQPGRPSSTAMSARSPYSDRVVDQVGEAALEQRRDAAIGRVDAARDGDGRAPSPRCPPAGSRAAPITSTGCAGSRLPRPRMNSSVSRHHRFHLPQVPFEFRAQFVVVEQLGAQAHPGDRRLEIVRHRGEHPRAVLDQADQPRLHRVEGAGGAAHFRRARLPAAAGGGCRARARRPPRRAHAADG